MASSPPSAQNAAVALKEDEALQALRRHLKVATSVRHCDPYLLRYLRATNLSPEEAKLKLERRRAHERTLLDISVTPHVVDSLRSGAFAYLGLDVFHRPVLYLRIGKYRRSPEGAIAEDRLALVVLEYMQSIAEERGGEAQCILLADEEGAGIWPLHESLPTLVQKYYPSLIGAVFVVNGSWGMKRILRMQVAAGTGNIRNLVQLVSTRELPSVLSEAVVPKHFGGSNDIALTCPPGDFSERVLRHWFALTSLLQREASGEVTRAVFIPLPRASLLTGPQPDVAAARRADRAVTLPHVDAATPQRPPHHHRDPAKTHTGTADQTTVTARTAHGDEYSDDGRCSLITDLDGIVDDDDDDTAASVPTDGPGDVGQLRRQLAVEAQRRRELERTVQSLQLGAPLTDPTAAAGLTAALRKHHEEVNLLVAEVCTSASSRTAAPTLAQLLEQTDRALLNATGGTRPVPLMAQASTVTRSPKSGCAVQ